MGGLERILKGDEKRAGGRGPRGAIADCASRRGDHGFLRTEFPRTPAEFCIRSTHPEEAAGKEDRHSSVLAGATRTLRRCDQGRDPLEPSKEGEGRGSKVGSQALGCR